MHEYLQEISTAFRSISPRRTRHTDPDRLLPCPVCTQPMAIERLFGIDLDVCQSHGMWFDVGEAHRLVERVETGERASAEVAVAEARRQGKLSGSFLGLISLVMDEGKGSGLP